MLACEIRIFAEALLLLVMAAAQVPARSAQASSLTLSGPGQEEAFHGDRYALLVGVENYDALPGLSGPNKDVCVLRQVLIAVAGFKPENVTVLAKPGSCLNVPTMPPTSAQLVNALNKFNSNMPKGSFFVLAFSGHGVSKENESYLMLQDSTEVNGTPARAVSVGNLVDSLVGSQSGPEHMLFLLDACRNSENSASTIASPDQGFAESFARIAGHGRMRSASVIFSATLGEQSYIRSSGPVSFFTWAVIKGLIGEAAQQDGRVTLADLSQYVEKEVPELIKVDFLSNNKVQQHPTTRNFGIGQEGLVVAKLPAPSTMFFYSLEVFIVPKSKEGKILASPLHVDLVSPRPLGFLDETLPLNIRILSPLDIIRVPYDKIDNKKVAHWDYLVKMTFHHGRWHRAFVMCPLSPHVPETEPFERSQEIKTYMSDGVLVIDPLISFMMWGHALRDPEGVMGEEGASGSRIEYNTYSMKCLER